MTDVSAIKSNNSLADVNSSRGSNIKVNSNGGRAFKESNSGTHDKSSYDVFKGGGNSVTDTVEKTFHNVVNDLASFPPVPPVNELLADGQRNLTSGAAGSLVINTIPRALALSAGFSAAALLGGYAIKSVVDYKAATKDHQSKLDSYKDNSERFFADENRIKSSSPVTDLPLTSESTLTKVPWTLDPDNNYFPYDSDTGKHETVVNIDRISMYGFGDGSSNPDPSQKTGNVFESRDFKNYEKNIKKDLVAKITTEAENFLIEKGKYYPSSEARSTEVQYLTGNANQIYSDLNPESGPSSGLDPTSVLVHFDNFGTDPKSPNYLDLNGDSKHVMENIYKKAENIPIGQQLKNNGFLPYTVINTGMNNDEREQVATPEEFASSRKGGGMRDMYMLYTREK